MIDADKAKELIRELSSATAAMINTQTRNGFTKSAMAREDRAAKALFIALVGRKPTTEEIKSMLD